jgi:TonB-linked SusC/RagA family outer membrane protein
MKNKILYKLQLLVLASVALFSFNTSVSAQTEATTVSGTLVDEQGNPLTGVTVYNPKGKTVISDSAGYFEINAEDELSLLFEKEGYDKKLLPVSELTGQVTLNKSELLASEDDLIKMGISTKYKREMTGAVSTISPKNHLTYDHTQYVGDYIRGLLLGVQGFDNIRGLGNALYVIDGVIGRTPDILNMDEIDQITVLKDANAVALYGNQAANGVIVINTKRGQINRRMANVNVRYGVREPLALPKYLGSAEYMELYNEARLNDGLGPSFDSDLIEEYRSGNNPYRYPNVDYFSDEYLRSYASRADVVSEFAGGNERSQYYINMGWNFYQSLVKLNPEVNVGSNRFNVRGNIDIKINDWIRSSVDAVAIVSNDKSALIDWFAAGATIKPNTHAPLLPPSMIVDTSANGTLESQLEAANLYDGMLLGTSQAYPGDTLIANTLAGGYLNSNFRSTQFNNSVDFDLDMIAEGLSARTYLSFDFYDVYDLSIENKYQRYQPDWMGDSIVGLTSFGDIDRKDLTERVSTDVFVSRLGFYGLLNYQKSFMENHSINATLLGYVNSHKQTEIIQIDKNSHIGFQFTYDFRKKLFVDFSSAYIHSIKLPEGNRGGISPTVGLAYILSEENFIKGIGFINFLKVKASAGIIKSDIGINSYFLYDENYTEEAWISWADGTYTSRTRDISQGANDEMTFEDRVDLNIGFESYLLNSLWLEFNYFKTNKDNQLTKLEAEYPSFYSVFNQYSNYNKDSYNGFELGLNYLKAMDDFSVQAGLNMMYSKSEVKKRSEIYSYDYLYHVGKPVDAYFGLEDEGFYAESDFSTDANGKLILNENLPVPAFGSVQPGDIKYVDQNDDGIIDANDQIFIGQWQHPWSFGMNLKLTYKRLSLFVLGIAQTGGDNMLHTWGNNVLYDNYYWVDGNDKYSEVALDRWTPETANTATYPRLSSTNNTHNFQTSTFWLYDNSYLDIERVQLTYELGANACQKLKMKALSVNIAGVNLLRIAENKEYQQLNIGYEPQYRYYTIGLRTSF